MKTNNKKGLKSVAFITLHLSFIISAVLLSSCRDDLLEQTPTGELSSDLYWKTEQDAISAEAGMLSDIRYLFNRDYYLDGCGEYVHRTRSGKNRGLETDGETCGRAAAEPWNSGKTQTAAGKLLPCSSADGGDRTGCGYGLQGADPR